MLALSIHEPWASAIVNDKKTIECRNWKPKKNPGEFLVQASKIYSDGTPNWLKKLYPKENCKLGYIIGTARLLDVYHYTSDREFEQDSHFHLCKWTPEELGNDIVERSEFGFVLVDPKRVEPIKCRGMLNFFDVKIDQSLLSKIRTEQPGVQLP
jgi:hypothetical protein